MYNRTQGPSEALQHDAFKPCRARNLARALQAALKWALANLTPDWLTRLADLACQRVPPMAQSQPVLVPSQLVWQLIKGNNCFIVNGLHGKKFSSEPGNLYNLHSYKHSGAQSVHVVRTPCALDQGSSTCVVFYQRGP